ncbi:MAG: prepilin-type N-terminal cleavage/methylation domain-containing protein [Planctomycetaceae bacterium]|nr:prepilin-type N-terminal cleavage/methylation domain-containing protein [Planctomycetaceae bacterium]
MKNKGFSLVECMVTLVLLLITIGAVMSFRCYTVTAAERAEDHLMAAHTALLLSEAWGSSGGDPAFTPLSYAYEPGLQITAVTGQITLPEFDGNYAGSYRVQLNGKSFDAHLYYKDYPSMPNTRSIHVIAAWQDARGRDRQFHLPTLTSL